MKRHSKLATIVLLLCGCAALAAPPASRPADPDIEWMLSHATTEPTSQPADEPTSRPGSPLERADDGRGARVGVIITSDDERYGGTIATTREKPIRVWDDQKKEYRDVPFAAIKSMEAQILWERDEPEWHFKDSGSDIKEYTGKTYPARELVYKVTLLNGQTVTGGIVAPLYVSNGKKEMTLVLNKRQKGEVGVGVKQLVYVKRVEFEEKQ